MAGLALVGRSRSGKTVLGGAIQELTGVRLFALADEAKRIFSEATGMNFFDEEVKVKQRGRLIEFAELCRRVEPMCWVRRTPVDTSDIVVTDVRMRHEFEYLRRKGYFMVGLDVDDDVLMERGGYTPMLGDPDYETAALIDECDVRIEGNGPPHKLAAAIIHEWYAATMGEAVEAD